MGRELIKRDSAKVNNDVIWLLLASILSRHTITSDKEFKSLIQSVLDKVDDLDIQEEWKEGIGTFFQIARQQQDNQYSDQRIWSDAGNLLKKIYSPAVLNADTGANYYKVQDNIWRLINLR